MDDELFTLPQVARMLGMSETAVRLWVYDEKLPAFKREGDRKWYVKSSDLERFREERRPRREQSEAVLPSDWSEVPERAVLDLAASATTTPRSGQ